MPIMKESPRTGTKCYIHEMQRPLVLPFQLKVYHVCSICQLRLLELAKAGIQFKLGEEAIALSVAIESHEKQRGFEKEGKIKKTKPAQKKMAKK